MKSNTFISEELLITKAIDVLIKTLGPVETSRFLTLPRYKRMDSVERHQRWQAMLSQEAFFDSVFQSDREY